VVGTVNGLAATGSGQSLTSTDGVRLRISATSAGSLGTVTVSNGYAAQLSNLIDTLTNADTGAIASRTTGLNSSIKRIDDQITSFEERMTTLEANYRRQFSSLDAALSQMNTTSSFLTKQLASLSSSS
jgi:flagellar hook-associated protein 2